MRRRLVQGKAGAVTECGLLWIATVGQAGLRCVDHAGHEGPCRRFVALTVAELAVAWRQARGNGRCPRCGEVHDGPPDVCRACLDQIVGRRQTKAEERQAEGLCSCGERPEDGGRLCPACRAYVRDRMRIRRGTCLRPLCELCGLEPRTGQSRLCFRCHPKKRASSPEPCR